MVHLDAFDRQCLETLERAPRYGNSKEWSHWTKQRVSIARSENNGIYLPIRQLSRSEGALRGCVRRPRLTLWKLSVGLVSLYRGAEYLPCVHVNLGNVDLLASTRSGRVSACKLTMFVRNPLPLSRPTAASHPHLCASRSVSETASRFAISPFSLAHEQSTEYSR